MRVATYTQPAARVRGSVAGLGLLIVTILLGMGVVPTIIAFAAEPLVRLITPLWLLCYLVAFTGLVFSNGINWISWLVRYRILLVFLMLGTITSVAWSVDAQVSAERTVHLLGSTLIAIYIGFTVPLLTTLRLFSVALGICIVASIVAVLALPELGLENYQDKLVWRGVFNTKNDLGFWAGVGLLLNVTLSDSTQSEARRVLYFIMAGVCLAVLGLSQSATSLLAMLVAGALSLYLFIAIRFQLGFIRMAFVAVLFTALVALAIANIETAELVGRTGDLTGRSEVWRQTWKLIMERPLTGYGYGSLWFPNDDTLWIQQSLTDFTWIVFHAHNGFLQVASEIGLPLSLIALLMVAQQLIEIFYCQYERQQVGVLFVLAFAVAYLISNYSEARFLVSRELFWIFFLALPISMLRQINVVSVQRKNAASAGNGVDSSADGGNVNIAVPGKPWLRSASSHSVPAGGYPGASAGGGLLHYEGRHAIAPAEKDTTVNWFNDTSELGSNTLSLTKTDIDLGELVDDVVENTSDFDDNSSLTDVEKIESSPASLLNTGDIDEFDTLPSDQTLGNDRYDKSFDDSGEWDEFPRGKQR